MNGTVLILLLVFLVILRIRRSIGFQLYRESTLIVRMVSFGILIFFLLSGAIIYPMLLIGDGIGIIAGLVLAYIATNHAKFEKREKGLYFKTHIWVEISIIALFLARFTYRFFILKSMFQPHESAEDIQKNMQTMQDPLTGATVFAFCAYYIGYFSFILKEGKKVLKEELIQTPPKAGE
jgi:hypothetical protein